MKIKQMTKKRAGSLAEGYFFKAKPPFCLFFFLGNIIDVLSFDKKSEV